MPLHIDLRPDSFDDFIGNSLIVKSLKSLIKREDRPHSYLFSGPSGCGKTSLARIVAKELNCADMDLQEINMSNNRGIDTAREIISNCKFKPLSGKTRVYILDEIHQSTKEFMNAILKIIEEPPVHVYFIFCTTDPDKIIPTVKNRCSKFSVSRLKTNVLYKFIESVCEDKKISLSGEIIRKIAKSSNGSPRDCLIKVDQVKDLSDGSDMEILLEEDIGDKTVIDLCRILLNENIKWKELSSALSLVLKNIEPETIRRGVLGYMSSVALSGNKLERACYVIDWFEDNFYNSGKAGLILACHNVFSNWK